MELETPDRYLFLFAHPDDDVFIAGTMKLLLDAGADVHAAWLTSGDFFGKGVLREHELAEALDILGLPNSRAHVLRFPDLGLVRCLDQAVERVTALVRETRPTRVVANAFEGGHPDHDCVNFLAYEGCSRAALDTEIFEFPLYNGAGRPLHWWWRINGFPDGGPPNPHRPLTSSAIDCKYRMMGAYSTQWVFMIPARLAAGRSALMRVGEPHRRCPGDRDHTLRPHAGKLNYERWFNRFMKIGFEDYRAAVIRARDARP